MKIELKLGVGCFMLLVFLVLFIPMHSFSQDNNCVCAECGRKCGDGHEKTCSYYQKSEDEAAEDDTEERASDLNQRGLSAFRNGYWVNAIGFFTEALKLTPNDYRIRQNLQNAESAQQQEAARQKQLQDAQDLNLRGNAAFQNGKWAEAITFYRQALQLSPYDAAIIQNLKNAEQSLKNTQSQELARQQQALAYQQLLAEANSLNEKGIAEFRNGKWAVAINYYQEALKLTPDSVVIRQNLQDAEQSLKNAQAKASLPQKPIAKGKKTAPQGHFIKDNNDLVSSLKKGKIDPLPLKRYDPAMNPSKLAKIKVPPLPIPVEKEWHEFLRPAAEHSEWIKNGVDLALLGWDIAGRISKGANAAFTVLLILDKTVLAGVKGGIVFMGKRDHNYEVAENYLNNPGTSTPFARLVLDLTNKGVISSESFKRIGELKYKGVITEAEYEDMVKTAKIITRNTKEIFWDAMLSREAKAAMVQKALMETGLKFISVGMSGISRQLLGDYTKRESVYESIFLERKAALIKLQSLESMEKPTEEIRRQVLYFNGIAAQTDKQLRSLFHINDAPPKLLGFLIEQFPYEKTKK